MTKIIININNHQSGRPVGSTKEHTQARNSAIIKARNQGMRIKTIANLLGINKSLVYAILKDNKC